MKLLRLAAYAWSVWAMISVCSLPTQAQQQCWTQIQELRFDCAGDDCPPGMWQQASYCDFGSEDLSCYDACGYGQCCETEYTRACYSMCNGNAGGHLREDITPGLLVPNCQGRYVVVRDGERRTNTTSGTKKGS